MSVSAKGCGKIRRCEHRPLFATHVHPTCKSSQEVERS